MLGFLLLAKLVVGEGLGATGQSWNCASLTPKIFKTLPLPALPSESEREELQPPALVLLKKLPAAGRAAGNTADLR